MHMGAMESYAYIGWGPGFCIEFKVILLRIAAKSLRCPVLLFPVLLQDIYTFILYSLIALVLSSALV